MFPPRFSLVRQFQGFRKRGGVFLSFLSAAHLWKKGKQASMMKQVTHRLVKQVNSRKKRCERRCAFIKEATVGDIGGGGQTLNNQHPPPP